MSDCRPTPRIIYIASAAHSGSTLLDLVLGSHSRLQSLGELKVLAPTRAEKRDRVLADQRTCGAADKRSCPFWKAVDERLCVAIGTGLGGLDVDPADTGSFERHNRALFESRGVANSE